MTVALYGIPNCDSVKKARTLLADKGVDYTFHDYKKQGVPDTLLRDWVKLRGWELLLNRKGTTWRSLDESQRNLVVDAATATQVMLDNPSTIKRPVIVDGKRVLVGLDEVSRAFSD